MPQLSKQFQQQVIRADQDPNFQLWDAGGIIQGEDDLLLYKLNGDLREYSAIENDPKLGALCDERRRAPSLREPIVYADGDSPEAQMAAEIIRRAIETIQFDELCCALNHACFTGRSIVELFPDVVEKRLHIEDSGIDRELILPVRFESKDAARLIFAKESDPRKFQHHMGFECRQTIVGNMDGEPLPLNKFMIYTFGSLTGNPNGKGIYRRLYWLNQFKKEVLKLGLVNSDGRPIPYASYQKGAAPEDVATAKQMLAGFYKNSWMLLPDTVKVEFASAFVTGQVAALKDFLSWFDSQAATCIVGATLTSSTDSEATRGNSQVHFEVSEQRAKIDSDLLSSAIKDYFCRPIIEWNLPGAPVPSVYRDFGDRIDRRHEAEIDRILFDLGWKPTEQRIAEVYGEGYIPIEPQDGQNDPVDSEDELDDQELDDLGDDEIDNEDLMFAEGDVYGIWFGGRRTPILVRAKSRSEAVSKARKKKRRGGDNVEAARLLKDWEKKMASGGKWLRSGPNAEKPGELKRRGYGPKPSNHSESDASDESADFEAGDRFKHKKLWRKAYDEAKRKFNIFPSAYSSAYIVQAYKRLVKEAGLSVKDAFNYDESGIDLDELIELSEPMEGVANFDLAKWFKDDWVRIGNDGSIQGECGGRDDSEGFPKCLPRSKAESMTKDERKAAVVRKRRKVKRDHSGKPVHVATKGNADHAEPIEAKGNLLSDDEFDSLAEVTEADVLAAIGEAVENATDD